MSYYNKYKFVSPEPIYAIIKEELKSYFDTGAVDDLLFPVYTKKCLDKLGKGMHPIVPVVLYIEDFTARLPENFHAVREAWYCVWTNNTPYQLPNAFYSQTADLTSVQVSPLLVNEVEQDCPEGEDCTSSVVQAVYKTLTTIPRNAYHRSFLLKPGRISFDNSCEYNYNDNNSLYGVTAGGTVPHSADYDSFDLHDNKFVTTFREGIVETLMYVTDFDDLGNQTIPDNYRIKEYIEAYIKYKVFETLANQTNDETFKQLQQKTMGYKMLADEAYIMAEMEIKKQDVYTKQRRIKKTLNRLDRYELPTGRTRGYGRRRRNY